MHAIVFVVMIVNVRSLLTSKDCFPVGNMDGISVVVNGVTVPTRSWCLLCLINENVLNDMRASAGGIAVGEREGATSLVLWSGTM